MKIFQNLQEFKEYRNSISNKDNIGFIPTMGKLHVGHFHLFKESIKNNKYTIVSIFVNPTQFNEKNDYLQYSCNIKKDIAEDIEKIKKYSIDAVIIPNAKELYKKNDFFYVKENFFSKKLEGKFRKNHFQGVLTIVMKFFNIVRPNYAYFGEKDYQQYYLIKYMTIYFFMDIKIILCETIRDKNFLALSSRNTRLNKEEYKLAKNFPKIFLNKNYSCNEIRKKIEQLGIEVEYVEEYFNRRFISVKINNIRLIDNIKIK